MELILPWFNDEFINFVIVVPMVPLLEEILVACQFSRGLVGRVGDLRGISTEPDQD